MRKWLVVALSVAVAAACNSPTAPNATSDSKPTTKKPKPPQSNKIKHDYVLYAVPQKYAVQGAGSTPSSPLAKVMHPTALHLSRTTTHVRSSDSTSDSTGAPPPNSDSIFTLEPWNADSMVYAIGDSASCPSNAGAQDPNQTCAPPSWQITLNVQVVDFANDSNAVPGDTIRWVVDSDQYSWNPGDANPANGLSAPFSVTDSNGNATVNFTYSGPFLTGTNGPAGYGGYFYVQAFMTDTTGAQVQQAKFYLVGWGFPGLHGVWDSTAAIAGQPYDLSQHVALWIVRGVDTKVGTIPILSAQPSLSPFAEPAGSAPDSSYSLDPNCSITGIVVTCTNPGQTTINIWPNWTIAPANTIEVCCGGSAVSYFFTLPIQSAGGMSPAAKRLRRTSLQIAKR